MFVNKKFIPDIQKVGPKNMVIDEYGDTWFYVEYVDDVYLPYHLFKYIQHEDSLAIGISIKSASKNTADFSNMAKIIIRYDED